MVIVAVVMNECCCYLLLILYFDTLPSIKITGERGGTYGFIKGKQNSNEFKVRAITNGSREVGNDVHHRRSEDNTETYRRK